MVASPAPGLTDLVSTSTEATRALIETGDLGFLAVFPKGTPAQVAPALVWAADNGCYTLGARFDPDRFLEWLEAFRPFSSTCRFVTAPDVVGDAAETLRRSAPYFAEIRDRGFPVALVAQDGLEDLVVPWGEFDVLFMGGTTGPGRLGGWKWSEASYGLMREARRHGKAVHMGRVNGGARLGVAATMGAATADGTILAFGPDANLPRVRKWLADLRAFPTLDLAQ